MATEAEIRRTLDRYGETQAENDLDAWLELFAVDAVQLDPVGTPARRGRTGLVESWNNARAQAPTMTFHHEDVIVCGQEAVLVLTVRCSDTAGRRFDVRLIDVFEFDNYARITMMRSFWNMDRVFYSAGTLRNKATTATERKPSG